MTNSKEYELAIKIAGKVNSSFNKSIKTANSSLGSLGTTAKKAAKVGIAALTTLALAVTGVGVAAVKSAAEYEQQIANVSTLLDGTVEEVSARTAELGDDILGLSNNIGTATSDLTDGAYQVISAFGDTADTAKILETAAKSAAAGNATTTESINLLSAVTKGYGDTSATAVSSVSDLAFETVKLGQTTFGELASSMGSVTGSASTLGIATEDLFGAFATLTGVTGSTAEVSTQLNKLYSELMDPTDEVAKAIQNAGYASASAMIESEGLQGVLSTLMDTVDGDSVAFYNLWGNVNSAKAATALAGAQADNYAKKAAAMYEATGATDEAFQRQTDTLAYSAQAIKNLGQNFLTEVGRKILPYIKDAAEKLLPKVSAAIVWLTEKFDEILPKLKELAATYLPIVKEEFKEVASAVRNVADVVLPPLKAALQWILDNGTTVKAMLIAIAAGYAAFKVVSVISGLVTAMKAWSAATKGVTLAQKLLNVVMAANPIGIIIAAVAALVAAFIYLWNNCEGFRNFWINLWENVKSVVASVADWLAGAWETISGVFSAWYEATLKPIVDGVIGIFSGIIDFIRNVFQGNWEGAWQAVVDIFGSIFDTIGAIFKAPINGIIKVLNWFIGKINTISIGPLPDWGILGEYAGATIGFNIPTIPELADGAIATSATLAMIGEGSEPEAVLPLSKLAGMLDSQTPGTGASGAVEFVFAPVQNFYGDVSKKDIEDANTASFAQFKKFMQQYEADQKRKAFA